MKRSWLRILMISTVLGMGTGMCAMAAGMDEFVDFGNADGSYSYLFMDKVEVTMSEEWYQNTFVKADETSASFYHRDSHEKYLEEGIEQGGFLFRISYSVNSDFKDLDEMTYIGFDEEECLNYFAVKPTDYPAYGADAEIRAEYDSLWAQVDEVIGSIELLGAETAQASEELPFYERNEEVPFIVTEQIQPKGTAGEEVAGWAELYRELYQNRVAADPEVITYEVAGTDRALAGIQIRISSEDGMDTITHMDLIEERNGSFMAYHCAYLSQTYADDKYEDENTYFEFFEMIDSMTDIWN